MQLNGNKILITGGATGIGFALAERFLREDNQVIVCGRRAEALADARRRLPALVTRVSDVSTAAAREELVRWLASEHPDTSVLVNNAGIQNWMTPSDDDFFARARQELAVNVEAPLHLSELCLKQLRLRTIVNVTSGLAFVPFVKVPVYSATKAFLHSFTLALRELAKAADVEVVELIPPALNTDLGGKGLHDHAPPVSSFIDAVFEQLEAGKVTATYAHTEGLSRAGEDVLAPAFERLNRGR
jgi:uncharacterized oxidoreductase